MISQLRGVVVAIDASTLVIDVHGVGLAVVVPERTASVVAIGEETLLHTSMLVREDDISLVGFAEPAERTLFDLLRSVSGVGPKSAIGVLNHYTADQVANAIVNEDDGAFKKVSGIGPKTAKLIILSLHGKLAAPTHPASGQAVDSKVSTADQTAMVQALIGLGWSERVARKGVAEVMESLGPDEGPPVGELVRRALLVLGPQSTREAPR